MNENIRNENNNKINVNIQAGTVKSDSLSYRALFKSKVRATYTNEEILEVERIIELVDDRFDPVYEKYTFEQFVLAFHIYMPQLNKTVYDNLLYLDAIKIRKMSHDFEMPLSFILKDVLLHSTMLDFNGVKRLFFSTGKVAREIFKFFGYQVKIKSDPNNKESCTLVYVPIKNKRFNVVKGNMENTVDGYPQFCYTLKYSDIAHTFFVKSAVWNMYRERMLLWHNLRGFAKVEFPNFQNYDFYEVDDSGDHIKDKYREDHDLDLLKTDIQVDNI